ncbi:MAG: hypothetical protein FWF60_01025 [Oscillospiraceae bacterium]|nr:hypothetical protein [Oscillospiraceae bacterium]
MTYRVIRVMVSSTLPSTVRGADEYCAASNSLTEYAQLGGYEVVSTCNDAHDPDYMIVTLKKAT